MRLVITFIIALMSLTCDAKDLNTLFQKGNTHYSKEEFLAALNTYKTIEAEGFQSAELLYNIGNSYLKLDSTASAILYYERARKLNPSDEDILFNLEAANQRTVDKIDKMPVLFIQDWWQRFTSILTVEGWAFLVVVCCWLFFIFTTIYLISTKRGTRILFFSTASLALVMTVFIYIITVSSYYRQNKSREGIIFAPSITVKSAPASGKDLFVLHEGTKVRIVETSDGWIKIRIGNGNVGWLPESSLEVI